jgi:hypothetical protein
MRPSLPPGASARRETGSVGGSTPTDVTSRVPKSALKASKALIAAQNVLLAGGTQANAEKAAYSVLVLGKDNQSVSSFVSRLRGAKKDPAAQHQAEIIASMAWLSGDKIQSSSLLLDVDTKNDVTLSNSDLFLVSTSSFHPNAVEVQSRTVTKGRAVSYIIPQMGTSVSEESDLGSAVHGSDSRDVEIASSLVFICLVDFGRESAMYIWPGSDLTRRSAAYRTALHIPLLAANHD